VEGRGGGGGYANECVMGVLEDVMLTIVEDEVLLILDEGATSCDAVEEEVEVLLFMSKPLNRRLEDGRDTTEAVNLEPPAREHIVSINKLLAATGSAEEL
jgi:hypothetical protein